MKKLVLPAIVVSVLVIGALAWLLIATPSPMVKIVSPRAGDIVAQTFIVSGKARGNWYFEASFPLEVLDTNGNTIAQSHAQAQGDWMTTEYVPFEGKIIITNYTGPATLILHKDNPSGLPEHDDSISIPIVVTN